MRFKPTPAFYDILVIIIIGITSFIVASIFSLHSIFDEILKKIMVGGVSGQELPILFAILMLCLMVFSFRRWLETRQEIRRRVIVEEDLEKHKSQLEGLVMDRTAEIFGLHQQVEFILAATKTGLDIIDSDYNIVYIDKGWQKIYGDPDARKCYEYFMGRGSVCPGCGVKKALETKKMVVTEEVLVREGSRPVQVTTIPYQNEKGEWLVAEVNVDITERKKIEDALRLNEDKIRAIFDQTFQFIGMMTPDGKLIEANKTAMHFAGIKESDCIGKFFWDTPWWTHSKEMQDKLREAVARANKGETVFFEATHPASDGSIHYIDFSLKPVKDKRGNVIFLIPEGSDITDRKRMDEELRKHREHLEEMIKERTEELLESEKKFRVIFDESADGLVLAEIDTKRFSMVNKSICRMLGYTAEEMKDLTVRDIHPAGELENILERFEALVKGDIKTAESVPVKRKDGSIFYTDIIASPIVISNLKYIMGSFHDVTERKIAEEALRISEANYRSIFESASDAIMVRDIETYQTVDANRAACEMFGYAKEEMLDLHIKDFMTGEMSYKWEDARHFYERAADGEPQVFEWLAVDKAGRSFWVEANVKRAVIGGRYRLISMLRDITERKALLAQRDNFINTVSHELRTPLGAIKESVALIGEGQIGNISEKQMEVIEVAKRNVDRLKRLIDQVLDLQKIDAGKMELRLMDNNINEIIKEVHRTMISLAAKKGLKLTMKLDETLSQVRCDRDRIIEVLINLINNSVKFTQKGEINITSDRGDNFIRVAITDTGGGIKAEDMPKLFQRFSQLERKTGGTGLGLAICKEMIELHKGKIWAESEFGKGTTIYFLLPVKERRV